MGKGQKIIIVKEIKYGQCNLCGYKIRSNNEAFNLKVLNLHAQKNHPMISSTSISHKDVMTKGQSHINIKPTDVLK